MNEEKTIEKKEIGSNQGRSELGVRWAEYLFATRSDSKKPEIPRIVLAVYAGITVGLALLSTIHVLSVPLFDFTIRNPVDLVVPSYVYQYAVFGTTAYIFANKISTKKSLSSRQAFFRVFAVLPTAAGVYLLWSVLWPNAAKTAIAAAGVAFLTGLFVEVFLSALAALTDKLAPPSHNAVSFESGEDSTNEPGDGRGANSSETPAEELSASSISE